jgi:hypothetical protein
MPYYSMKDYSLVDFEKSKTKNKKYDAILLNQSNNKTVRIPFGDSRYQQYKDSTGLGLYSNKNHGDLKRRELYRQRHAKDIKKGYYSAGYMSYYFLW